jgi:putative restriction endonuclease
MSVHESQWLRRRGIVKIFVGITDYDWFRLHASKERVEEVNFWRPSALTPFKALDWGELFLFKLHSPRNFIVGGGFFARYLRIPVSLAWRCFEEANGATSLEEVRVRIAKYRKAPMGSTEDPQIGCILIEEPFFLEESEWIPSPADFKLSTQVGKGYNTESGTGEWLWKEIALRLKHRASIGPATEAAQRTVRFGKPVAVTPRLGQGSFRLLIAEAYRKRCAITRERTLPVLEAAHIRPYSRGGEHELPNGLLMRSDLHRLFDLGYITVEPRERKIIVSSKIREEYENGRDYYALEGQVVEQPENLLALPSIESLIYHNENVFRG